MSGGSAGNTMAGRLAGRQRAYIGKVRDDVLGGVFRHDITAMGVRLCDAGGDERAADGALPHPGDAGRAAHHEHLPRAPASISAPRTSTRR